MTYPPSLGLPLAPPPAPLLALALRLLAGVHVPVLTHTTLVTTSWATAAVEPRTARAKVLPRDLMVSGIADCVKFVSATFNIEQLLMNESSQTLEATPNECGKKECR